MRGGEKVLESLCRIFPDADIYTHVCDRSELSPRLRKHRIIETKIAKLPLARKLYQNYLPLMPMALEDIDLTGYDLVVSSESGPAKGVIVSPTATHICYCHSPMRYLWDHYHIYRKDAGVLKRLLMPFLIHKLRIWDVTSAARVDHFLANSNYVAARIRKYWRRDATVVHPPVAVEDFKPCEPSDRGDFYLWAGELVTYKRPDLVIEAFNKLDLPLVVIGGPEKVQKELETNANPNISFLGKVPFDILKDHMARCKALIFPGEEDFGIVPVEVMASGRPVIAYKRGGALDTVVEDVTGVFFENQTVESLVGAIKDFEKSDLKDAPAKQFVEYARKFDENVFQAEIIAALAAHGIEHALPRNRS